MVGLKEGEINEFLNFPSKYRLQTSLALVNFQGCLLVNTRHSDCSENLRGGNRQWEMDGIFLLKIKKKREEENGGNCGEMM